MKSIHSLNTRVNDFKLELQMWVLGWILASAGAVAGMCFYLRPSDAAVRELWTLYLLSKPLEMAGLGRFEILKWGQSMTTPSDFLVTLSNGMSPETLSKWASDLTNLAQTPALVAIALVGFAFIHTITSSEMD